MDEKTILIGVLTKTLNKSEQEVTELLYQQEGDELKLKDDAMDDILSLDSVRVENIKKNAPVPQDRLENEYKRGQKEAYTKFEKSLKEKYSVESDKEGVELVDSIITAKTKPGKLSDEDVKKHPLYVSLEKDRVPKEELEKVKKDFDNYKNNIEETNIRNTIKNHVANYLDEWKPIVSENPVVARNRREDYLSKFDNYRYQNHDDVDNTLILKSDGSRLEDGHGNPVKLKELARQIAEANYDFPKQDGKGNSGEEDGKKSILSINVPKNDEEYVAAMNNAKDFAEKKAIREAYYAKK